MIKTIFFDLDGTLLPMDQDVFTAAYFKRLAAKLLPYGYEPKALIDGIWAGTAAMIKNDGGSSNEQAFWARFCEIFGEEVKAHMPVFDEFYRVDFQNVAADCGFNPEAQKTVQSLREMGFTLVLATNPIFPAVATQSRVRWAGLDIEDFALYTSYENTGYCKPNPLYYADLLARLGLKAEECLMVGNDVEEDMVAAETGMSVFLLTDCLINKYGKDISAYAHGDFAALLDFVKANRA